MIRRCLGWLRPSGGSRRRRRCFSSSPSPSPSPSPLDALGACEVGQPSALSHPELMRPADITPGLPADEFLLRRRRLLAMLPPGALALLASAPVRMMTEAVPFPFRQDADFAFLTGCTQPGALAVLCPRSGLSLFLPQPPPREALWQGPAADLDAATRFFRADRAFPLSALPQLLPPLLRQASRVFHSPKTAPASPYSSLPAFQQALADSRVHDVSAYTHELRWVKSPSEISLMRHSASIACQVPSFPTCLLFLA